MARAIDNSPKADHLMGSLRSMGYSFESAIADIIDNSVSAGAREIHINFCVDKARKDDFRIFLGLQTYLEV